MHQQFKFSCYLLLFCIQIVPILCSSVHVIFDLQRKYVVYFLRFLVCFKKVNIVFHIHLRELHISIKIKIECIDIFLVKLKKSLK